MTTTAATRIRNLQIKITNHPGFQEGATAAREIAEAAYDYSGKVSPTSAEQALPFASGPCLPRSRIWVRTSGHWRKGILIRATGTRALYARYSRVTGSVWVSWTSLQFCRIPRVSP